MTGTTTRTKRADELQPGDRVIADWLDGSVRTVKATHRFGIASVDLEFEESPNQRRTYAHVPFKLAPPRHSRSGILRLAHTLMLHTGAYYAQGSDEYDRLLANYTQDAREIAAAYPHLLALHEREPDEHVELDAWPE